MRGAFAALVFGFLLFLSQSAMPATAWAQDDQAYQDDQANNNQAGSDQADMESFYDELSPYGQWLDDPRFGQVWKPTAVGGNS